PSTDVTNRNYEEAITSCTMLSEETIGAIENWTDIVPEADIKSQIGVVTGLQDKLTDNQNALEKMRAELDAKTQHTSGKETELKQVIADLMAQREKLQRALANSQSLVLSSANHDVRMLGDLEQKYYNPSIKLSELLGTGPYVNRIVFGGS